MPPLTTLGEISSKRVLVMQIDATNQGCDGFAGLLLVGGVKPAHTSRSNFGHRHAALFSLFHLAAWLIVVGRESLLIRRNPEFN